MLSLDKFQKNLSRPIITTESLEDFQKFKLSHPSVLLIGTHSGTFHGDEVLATLLLKFHPLYKNSGIVRSRNNSILDLCDIVCDVGSIFDPAKKRFDHHMKEFVEVFDDKDEKYKGMKLSSAGLVYKYLGKDILINILKEHNLYEQNKNHIDEIYIKLYDSWILSVDAIDNGIDEYKKEDNAQKLYDNDTSYGSRIGRLNPEWNSVNIDPNERFLKGTEIAEEELYYHLMKLANSYFLAYDIVFNSVQKALAEKKKYIVMEKGCPFVNILFDIEKQLNLPNYFLYGIHPRDDNSYGIKCMPASKGSFECRKPFLKAWRGKRNEELQAVSGLNDGVFCHATGFLAIFKSLENCIKAVEININTKE